MNNFTLLGGTGFIGSHLCRYLEARNISYDAPQRGDESIYDRQLGHVIYCIGMTADFREKPFETVDAHVCNLLRFFQRASFQTFLYLSSTRIYLGAENTYEDSDLRVNANVPEDLFNISKLMGESVCLSIDNPSVRIARVSNVVGSDWEANNFLSMIIREAITKGKINLHTTMQSEKDYIYMDDVLELLVSITTLGSSRLYNVASGVNRSNLAIIERIREITGCSVDVDEFARTVVFPRISIQRITSEFDYSPINILDKLDGLLPGDAR